MKKAILLLLIVGMFQSTWAQEKSDTSSYANIAAIVFLDSFVVTAKRQGFNVEEFIQLVQDDESFYKAFQNLRVISYRASNQQQFFDKKGNLAANYTSETQQKYDGKCRTMEVLSASNEGNFHKKNGKYKYYTSKMYDQVFFTHGKVCNSKNSGSSKKKVKGIEKNVQELKKLIFQPGQKVDVPIIGGKTALFSKKMAPYYDYSITTAQYRDQLDCYVFRAKVKPQYQNKKEGKTIIKYLETYFEKKTFQVLGRKYQLTYKGALFDFDVKMDIELKKLGTLYLPEKISYQGKWDIPTKKPEHGTFEARFFDFN